MAATGSLRGRRVLFVAPPSRFDEEMFYSVWQSLVAQDAWLSLTADSSTGWAVGEYGDRERLTSRLGDIDLSEHDALVLVEPVELLMKSKRAAALVRQAEERGIPILFRQESREESLPAEP